MKLGSFELLDATADVVEVDEKMLVDIDGAKINEKEVVSDIGVARDRDVLGAGELGSVVLIEVGIESGVDRVDDVGMIDGELLVVDSDSRLVVVVVVSDVDSELVSVVEDTVEMGNDESVLDGKGAGGGARRLIEYS